MHDPRLPQLFELWFMNFGSQGVKVKTLLQKSPPPLLELFLRYAPDPADRHKISRLHMGRWLARITRGPPIAGWMLRSWTASGQLMFSCTEASLGDGLVRAAGARPPGAALIKIAPGTHPQDALKAALDQGRNGVLEAMCSGDALRVQDAQAFLKERSRGETIPGFVRGCEPRAEGMEPARMTLRPTDKMKRYHATRHDMPVETAAQRAAVDRERAEMQRVLREHDAKVARIRQDQPPSLSDLPTKTDHPAGAG
jgi:hypothetical protein